MSKYKDIEQGILNVSITLYTQVLKDTGDKRKAMEYVRKYLEYLQTVILQIEDESKEEQND